MKISKNYLFKNLNQKIVIELFIKFLNNNKNEDYILERNYLGLVENVFNEFNNLTNKSDSLTLYHKSLHYGYGSYDYCVVINSQGFEFNYFNFTKQGVTPKVRTETSEKLEWQAFLQKELGDTSVTWLNQIEKKYKKNNWDFDTYLNDVITSSLTTNQVKDLISQSNSENTDKELTL